MNILFMVTESDSANGICANAVMKELKSKGHKIFCITNREFGMRKKEIIDGIQYFRIKPRFTYQINSWCKNHTGLLCTIMSALSFLLNKLKLFISVPTWPLISPLYTYQFYYMANRIYKEEKYNLIISIYTQIDTIIAGHIIKNKYADLKFIPYFLDSLSGGYGPKCFSKEWTLKRGLKWEKKLLLNADKIIIMKSSEKHHNMYSSKEIYYNRMKVLDIPLFNVDYIKYKATNILNPNKINLVYAGSIPFHVRNPQYILNIFNLLRIDNCVFTIIGSSTCHEILKKAQDESKNNQIVIVNNLPHSEVMNVLSNADILVNIGNSIPSMVPSKIFEYMSFGKPIISTYPIENEPSIQYLKQYPLALLIKEDINSIDTNVKLVEQFINTNKRKKISIEKLEDIMYLNTPNAFVDEINKMV